MTNAEKFLKDGVDVKQFAEMIDTAYVKADKYADVCESTINWLKQPAKPTLTEDEKAILRNIDTKMWNTILRENGEITFAYKLSKGYRSLGRCEWFSHLFQFIKNGEEYPIEKLLKGE
jgi:hypothetical protein